MVTKFIQGKKFRKGKRGRNRHESGIDQLTYRLKFNFK